jgi:hypothetical protein
MQPEFSGQPPAVKEAVDKLVGAAVDSAIPILTENHAVLPYALAMPKDGKIAVAVAGFLDDSDPAEMREILRIGLRRQVEEGTLQGAVVVYDTKTLRPESDLAPIALCMQVEYGGMCSMDWYLPFKKGWLGGVRVGGFDDMYIEYAPFRIFPESWRAVFPELSPPDDAPAADGA